MNVKILVAKASRARYYLEFRLEDKATPAPHETVNHEQADSILEFAGNWTLEEPRPSFEETASGRAWPEITGGDAVKFEPGWSAKRVAEVDALFDRWHLNGMKAGCAHQEVVMEDDGYGRPRPSCKLTPPCPITDYRYGSAWLCEPLPADVEAQIRALG